MLRRELHDAREAGVEPQAQHAIGRVADAQPYNGRCIFCLHGSRGKVFVFRDDDGAGFQGVGPNRAVFGFAEPNVLNVACLVTGFLEPTG